MNAVSLRAEVHEQIEKIGSAEIVVGIPSFNNARTIGHVVRAVQAGLAKYFPSIRAVIVNSDGGSSDGTTDVVQNTSVDDFSAILLHHRIVPISKIAFPYSGIPGKGERLSQHFRNRPDAGCKGLRGGRFGSQKHHARMDRTAGKTGAGKGFDYVAPLYHRHKFDGTITNSIVCPLTRALYGKRVRQPIGSDFGFSGRVAQFYLTRDVWQTDVARFGIDIWMTTTAIANGFTAHR